MNIIFLEKLSDFPSKIEGDDEGLIAAYGSLEPDWLLTAYTKGLFPWYNAGEAIQWWCPNPRMVLPTNEFKTSKSFRNILNRGIFEIGFNTNFKNVLEHCSNVPRQGQQGTWLSTEMKEAYLTMHQLGWAHSVEVYQNNQLVGGLYGLAINNCFFGESMFSLVSNASKFALYNLCNHLHNLNVPLIDCQVYTEHLASLGAVEVYREDFISFLQQTKGWNKINIGG